VFVTFEPAAQANDAAEVRRCSFASRPTFAALLERLEAVIGSKPKLVQYRDTEDDQITLGSELEWTEFLPVSPPSSSVPFKLHVRAAKPTAVLPASVPPVQAVAAPASLFSALTQSAEAALERLFPMTEHASANVGEEQDAALAEAIRESKAEYEAEQDKAAKKLLQAQNVKDAANQDEQQLASFLITRGASLKEAVAAAPVLVAPSTPDEMKNQAEKEEQKRVALALLQKEVLETKAQLAKDEAEKAEKAEKEKQKKPSKWAEQLKQLHELGFSLPDATLEDLLANHKGDMVPVVEALLSFGQL